MSIDTILYCVTVEIDSKIADDWEQWMRDEHISDVISTGLFRWAKLFENTDSSSEERVAFEIQYRTTGSELEEYQRKHAEELQKEHTDRYKGRFDAKRRILKLMKKIS